LHAFVLFNVQDKTSYLYEWRGCVLRCLVLHALRIMLTAKIELTTEQAFS